MDKYIKVSDAIDWFRPYSHMEESIPFDVLVTDLQDSVPAADVAPVVHGKWEEVEELYGDIHYKCSSCGIEWCFIEGTPKENGTHYCPNCGAKMEDEPTK